MGSGRTVDLAGIEVRAPHETDVGDVAPLLTGSVEGRVLVRAGDDPSGIQVWLGERDNYVRQFVGADGRFLFEGVAPGERGIGANPLPGRYAASESRTVEVPMGGRAQVELDLSALATIQLAVRLTQGGVPAIGRQVYLEFDGRTNRSSSGGMGIRWPFGDTDEDCWVRGDVVPGTTAHVEIQVAGRRVRLPGGSIELVPDRDAEIEVDVELGSVELPRPPIEASDERFLTHTYRFYESSTPGGDALVSTSWSQGPRFSSYGKKTYALLDDPPRVRIVGIPVGVRSYRMTLEQGQNNQRELVTEAEGPVTVLR